MGPMEQMRPMKIIRGRCMVLTYIRPIGFIGPIIIRPIGCIGPIS